MNMQQLIQLALHPNVVAATVLVGGYALTHFLFPKLTNAENAGLKKLGNSNTAKAVPELTPAASDSVHVLNSIAQSLMSTTLTSVPKDGLTPKLIADIGAEAVNQYKRYVADGTLKRLITEWSLASEQALDQVLLHKAVESASVAASVLQNALSMKKSVDLHEIGMQRDSAPIDDPILAAIAKAASMTADAGAISPLTAATPTIPPTAEGLATVSDSPPHV